MSAPRQDEAAIRTRQKGRSLVMGVLLALLVILIFGIAIVKIGAH